MMKKIKFSSQNNSEVLTKNTPNSWLIENDIAFTLLSKQTNRCKWSCKGKIR